MIVRFLESFGKYMELMVRSFRRPDNWKMYWDEIVRQMYQIGVGSLTIVAVISIFIGAVTAVQFAYQLGDSMIPKFYIGYIVRDMTIIELAPTFTCLVLAGKVGSSIASEIGGMRQKEHIDAMEIMGVNTAGYIIMPRIVASITMIPLLVCLAAIISIIGAYMASVPTGFYTEAEFVRGLRYYFVPYNATMLFVKAFVFAFILSSVACFQGYYVKPGSIELGKVSTNAVVYGDILILLADYTLAVLLTT